MSKYYNIHIENPQPRLLLQAIDDIKSGAVAVVPTDCCYVMCCKIGDKDSEAKIADIRGYKDEHTNRLALLLADISQASYYAEIDNWSFKIMKKAIPGPYTFILPANHALPKRLHLKRKTVGIRIPQNKILLDLLKLYNEPLYSSTLWLPGDEFPYFEPDLIREKFDNTVDLIIDGGEGVPEMSSVVSLIDGKVEIIREGRGDCSIFD